MGLSTGIQSIHKSLLSIADSWDLNLAMDFDEEHDALLICNMSPVESVSSVIQETPDGFIIACPDGQHKHAAAKGAALTTLLEVM